MRRRPGEPPFFSRRVVILILLHAVFLFIFIAISFFPSSSTRRNRHTLSPSETGPVTPYEYSPKSGGSDSPLDSLAEFQVKSVPFCDDKRLGNVANHRKLATSILGSMIRTSSDLFSLDTTLPNVRTPHLFSMLHDRYGSLKTLWEETNVIPVAEQELILRRGCLEGESPVLPPAIESLLQSQKQAQRKVSYQLEDRTNMIVFHRMVQYFRPRIVVEIQHLGDPASWGPGRTYAGFFGESSSDAVLQGVRYEFFWSEDVFSEDFVRLLTSLSSNDVVIFGGAHVMKVMGPLQLFFEHLVPLIPRGVLLCFPKFMYLPEAYPRSLLIDELLPFTKNEFVASWLWRNRDWMVLMPTHQFVVDHGADSIDRDLLIGPSSLWIKRIGQYSQRDFQFPRSR